MSEMVEKVAKAIAPLAWAALGAGDTLAHKNRRAASLRHARAAIEAMREPTEAMLEASWRTTVKAPVDSRIACLLATPRDAHVHKMLLRYRAVIDAALSD